MSKINILMMVDVCNRMEEAGERPGVLVRLTVEDAKALVAEMELTAQIKKQHPKSKILSVVRGSRLGDVWWFDWMKLPEQIQESEAGVCMINHAEDTLISDDLADAIEKYVDNEETARYSTCDSRLTDADHVSFMGQDYDCIELMASLPLYRKCLRAEIRKRERKVK